jgi:multiple sugar transport system ATP-binding protein
MAGVTLKNLTKTFKNVVAVNNVNLEIMDQEFLVLVGPSGCGKTTALRMIAGLEEATEGEIYIGDRLVNDVSPKDRDIAMVFQNYALYPHMTVYDNMAFGLKLRRTLKPGKNPVAAALLGWLVPGAFYDFLPRQEIRRRVETTSKMLGLEGLLDRKPKQLSGGQRQRVALGRAIVREPKVFLMDEPLSNLDAKLRVQTRAELIKLHRRLGITTIYVTHDQVEAMTMGDRIAVMNEGVVQQVDTPLNLYNNPANKFVAGFIGSPAMNFLEADVVPQNGALYLAVDGFRVRVPVSKADKLAPYIGKKVVFGIRPEDIFDSSISTVPPTPDNTATADVEVTEPMGDRTYLYLTIGRSSLIANVDAETQAQEDQPLRVVFDMERSHAFDITTDAAIY